jgi:hypothetical protein
MGDNPNMEHSRMAGSSSCERVLWSQIPSKKSRSDI